VPWPQQALGHRSAFLDHNCSRFPFGRGRLALSVAAHAGHKNYD
jgi:hypothetical protein